MINKTLIIMRGISGSGKSTLAKQLGQNGVVFSTDEYHMIDGKYVYNSEKAPEYHLLNQQRAANAMEQGLPLIVIDNTNVTAAQIYPYAVAAIKYGYNVQFAQPNTPWAFDAEELAKRNTHGVPIEVIQDMLYKWESDLTLEKILALTPSMSPS